MRITTNAPSRVLFNENKKKQPRNVLGIVFWNGKTQFSLDRTVRFRNLIFCPRIPESQ